MEALMNVVEREPVVIGTSALDTGLMPALPSPAVLPVKDTKKLAAEKLEGEKKDANDIYFADPVIGYLLGRIPDDEGLAEDVIQEHKTWKKCLDYIYEQARKMKKDGKCVAVRDDTVYEWAEDYYHRDDKDEEEKKKSDIWQNSSTFLGTS